MEKLEVVTEEISSIKEIPSIKEISSVIIDSISSTEEISWVEKDMLSIVTKESKDVTHIISEEISRFLGTLRKFPQCLGS